MVSAWTQGSWSARGRRGAGGAPRGPRLRRALTAIAFAALLGAPVAAKDIFVTTTADGIANDGNCTLREAIRAANTNLAVDGCAAGQPEPAVDVIVLTEKEAPYRLTIAGPDDSSGDLDLYSSIDLSGAPSTIDAIGLGDRVLDLRAGAKVKLLMVALRGGDAGAFQGGGLYAGGGAIAVLFGSSIRGNRAGGGAGIAITGGASVTLHDSDVSNNAASHGILVSSATLALVDSTVADNAGAGVTAWASAVTVTASTVSGNSSTGLYGAGASTVVVRNSTIAGNGRLDLPRGGGMLIESPASASLYYSTVAGNAARTGGGVNVTGTLTLKGSILGANQASLSNPDCYSESASMTTQGFNLIQHEECGIQPLASDRVGVDPRLDALADWGGPTRTRRLLPGSPALDAGDPADFPPFDQRGEGRPRNGDADATARADLGAHENGNTIVVDTAADLASPDGKCSLRDAIRAANTDTAVDGCRAGFDRDLIWIDPMVVGDVFLGLTGVEDQAVLGDLDVRQEVDVAGPPDHPATIDGGLLERVFEVHAPARLWLSHLELMRTSAFVIGGGGMRIAPDAAATLFDVEVDGHSAAGEGGGGALVEGELVGEDVWFHDNATNRFGGGIGVDGENARLELRRARITANQNAQGNGGGIAVVEGRALLADTTIADNRATGDGGGVHSAATLDLINVTVAHNRADSDSFGGGSGGGLDVVAGTARLANTLIADNLASSSPDCAGTLVSRGYNLIDQVSCTVAAGPGDQLGVDAELAPVMEGSYATVPGSPARDAGSTEIAGSLGTSCSRRDALRISRPVDGDADGVARCDVGAVESIGVGMLDIDGDGVTSALSDGVLILRYLFGFTGDALTSGALPMDAPRGDSDLLMAHLEAIAHLLDVDGDGSARPFTDGVLILRYLFGVTGPSLTADVIGVGATRTTPEQVIAYLESILG